MSDPTTPPPAAEGGESTTAAAEGGESTTAAAGVDQTAPPAAEPDTGYTPAGVPTLEGVRDKIETRYGTALGATELAEDTPEARNAAERYAARQRAAEEKLAEIRDSMRPPGD